MAVVYKSPTLPRSRPTPGQPPPNGLESNDDPPIFSLTETPAGFHEDMDPEESPPSSRESQEESAVERLSRPATQSDFLDENDNDKEYPHKRSQSDVYENYDIMDDRGWDTDLENEEISKSYDATGRTAYVESCKNRGVVPASYFIRHMHDPQLEMRHHGLGPNGAKAIAISLVSNTNVLHLDLSDNWMGPDGGLAVCDMLKENCYITDLNLSDNKLSPSCVNVLSDIIVNSNTLTRISLSGNDFDDASAEIFADAITNTSKIEYLDLSHNLFGEQGGVILGPAISENSSIKHLDLSWNCIRQKGAIAIAQGIKNNIFMKKFIISWNGFGTDGALAIGDALKSNSVLEEIDIANNRISTEGAVLIGKGLSVNETLKAVRVGLNPMQSAGCYAIIAAVLKNPNSIIEELDFQGILVNKDYIEIETQCKEQYPDMKITHGGFHEAKKRKPNVHPMVKLHQYIESQNLRLIEFFLKMDKDGSMSVTREEFAEGIVDNNVPLTRDEVNILLNELDKDGDGEIDYRKYLQLVDST